MATFISLASLMADRNESVGGSGGLVRSSVSRPVARAGGEDHHAGFAIPLLGQGEGDRIRLHLADLLKPVFRHKFAL